MNLLLIVACTVVLAQGNIQPECYGNIQDACQMELLEAIAALPNTTRFPPLKHTLKLYQDVWEPAFKCAIQVNCSEQYSAKEIYDQVAFRLGVRRSDFDDQCIVPIFAEVHIGSFVCTGEHDYLTINGTLNKELLLKTKPCILTISEHVCSKEDQSFFKEHYDELMNMYTTKEEDKYELCASPYDKFSKIYCQNMMIRPENNMKTIKMMNFNDSDTEEVLRECLEVQKCYEDSCLIRPSDKVFAKKHYFAIKDGVADYKKSVGEFGDVSKNNCFQELNLYDFISTYQECTEKPVKIQDCARWAIEEKCGNITTK